jgi:integrase/recombinase XerD
MSEMFERFMMQKRTEGLARRTLVEYEVHFGYLLQYIEGDVVKEQMNADLFRGYIDWMLNERNLLPVTVNVRVRTMRAFFRFCFMEGYIDSPVHEKIKILKTEEDTIEFFTPAEVKRLFELYDQLLGCTLASSTFKLSHFPHTKNPLQIL